MPLRDRTGERPDMFERDGAAARALVIFTDLGDAIAARRPGQAIGVEIANTILAEEIAPHFENLALIAVSFPAFGDGRGFTIARALRAAGFAGRLRAVGPLIADQFAYALACGFDEVEIPEALAARQPIEQWHAALAAMPGGLAQGVSLLEARRLTRRETST